MSANTIPGAGGKVNPANTLATKEEPKNPPPPPPPVTDTSDDTTTFTSTGRDSDSGNCRRCRTSGDNISYSEFASEASGWLGAASAITGTLAVGSTLTGVGAPIGAALGVISVVAGASAAAIDCGIAKDAVNCGWGIATTALGAAGYAVRGASLVAQSAPTWIDEMKQASDVIGGVWSSGIGAALAGGSIAGSRS